MLSSNRNDWPRVMAEALGFAFNVDDIDVVNLDFEQQLDGLANL